MRVHTVLLVLAALFPTAAITQESITAEAVIDAPIGQVWNAWATSVGLRSWLAPHADIDAQIGGLMRANYDAKGSLGDSGTIENRVLSLEPERMLSIQVSRAPESFPFKARVGEMWTVLYFSAVADEKTKLRIVGLGFKPDREAQEMRDFFKRGNEFTLTQLQEHFAKCRLTNTCSAP
jgi:uncharacterized protein YndB with AHSA1/START domain